MEMIVSFKGSVSPSSVGYILLNYALPPRFQIDVQLLQSHLRHFFPEGLEATPWDMANFHVLLSLREFKIAAFADACLLGLLSVEVKYLVDEPVF